MKIITADRRNRTDGAAFQMLQSVSGSATAVLVAWTEGFEFNPDLLGIKEDYVLVCFCEYGWDWDLNVTGTHIWGVNSYLFPRYYNGDWIKFDNWVKENPPKLLLKRELLKIDETEKIRPIEYAVKGFAFEVQAKSEFEERPLSVFQYWGRSNECRLRIHADIWRHATEKGFSVCDNIYYIEKFLQEEKGEKWATFWIPHYYRVDISFLLNINYLSKLSLSWPGAGFKCFRSAEAPINSVMVMHENNFAWAYEWNNSNCILAKRDQEMNWIDGALENPNLYEIYLKGIENASKYQLNNYTQNYLSPLINSL